MSRRMHPPPRARPDPRPGTYSLWTWDHEAGDWDAAPRFAGLGLMAVRSAIREVEGEGYSNFSYLVEREPDHAR